MAKKRKAPRQPQQPSGPREVDPKDARLVVRTYEDVANSEDEYYAAKDRIDFDSDDGGRSSKRLKRQEQEDAFLEASDQEIFGDDGSDEDEEQDVEEAPQPRKGSGGKAKAKSAADLSDEEEGRGDAEEEGDEGWWGSSRKEYYNADAIETEADALVSRLLSPLLSSFQFLCQCVGDEDLTYCPGRRGGGAPAPGQEARQDAGG